MLHALVLTWLSHLMQPPSLLEQVTQPFYTRTITPTVPAPLTQAPALTPPQSPVRPSIRIATPASPKPPVESATDTVTEQAPPPPHHPPESAQQAASEAPAEEIAQAPDPETSLPLPFPETEPDKTLESPAADQTDATPEDKRTADSDTKPEEDVFAQSNELPGNIASAPVASAAADAEEAPAPAPETAPTGGSDVDSPPAFLANWPPDTRLHYQLGGNYRGELHGDAEVLWQREGTRYQAVIQLDVGILLSSRFTSQGDITEHGLRPQVYEEQVRKKRRGVRLGDDVQLDNGERVARPLDVQDAASQFVELAHRLATGQIDLRAGTQIDFWLARPGGVDEWTYDVMGEETIHLPKLGPIRAWHLKPRPLAKPRRSVTAEIWFAPSLQYLPVRILLTSGPETYVDLMVDAIQQK